MWCAIRVFKKLSWFMRRRRRVEWSIMTWEKKNSTPFSTGMRDDICGVSKRLHSLNLFRHIYPLITRPNGRNYCSLTHSTLLSLLETIVKFLTCQERKVFSFRSLSGFLPLARAYLLLTSVRRKTDWLETSMKALKVLEENKATLSSLWRSLQKTVFIS